MEVHQIELEMLCAELVESRDKVETLLEKYTDLYDFAPVGYLTLDQAGNIIEANLAASNLLEISRSALVNRSFKRFILAAGCPPLFEVFLQQLFATKLRQSCEVTLNVEGRHPIMIALEGLAFESGQACRVTLTDITELKRADADRLILNKLESMGILAGGIAHDFNNLLTAILLNLELAQMLGPPGEEFAQYLAAAQQAGLLARQLIAQLITFSEGGAPTRRAMGLSGLIQESVRLALGGSKIQCEFSLAPDLWPAEIDAAQIAQVIHGIARNAREAMPEAGVVRVKAENVVLSASEYPPLPTGDYIRIRISDQGTGIPPEVLPKIFDPYFSTKQRGTRKGMGLGLTIGHSIVHRHAGAITVESSVGVGTSLILHLPAVRKLTSEEPGPPPGISPGQQSLDDATEVRKAPAQGPGTSPTERTLHE